MSNAILWQWSKDQGHTPQDLAEALGYKSAMYVEQILRGWSPVTSSFIGRFIQAYPKHAHIFIDTPGGTP